MKSNFYLILTRSLLELPYAVSSSHVYFFYIFIWIKPVDLNFKILSQFFVMLVLLFCKLSEHYSQTNVPIIKTKKDKEKKRIADIFVLLTLNK